MKSILLINPPFNIAKENYDSSLSVGLLSIASYLKSKNVDVKIIDCARQSNFNKILEDSIKNFNIIGISVMTTQVDSALKISEKIREINKNAKIIWAGPHPTFFIEETVAHPLVDAVCYGEGEEVMLNLAKNIGLEGIKGIAYRKDRKIIKNEPSKLINPEEMPLLDWDLMPKEILKNLKLVPTLTSRGCPHLCTFCINAILRYRWRPRSVEQVLGDLEIIKEREEFEGKKLRFWDENFFVDIKRAKEIVRGIIERGLIRPWETTVRANYLRDGMIDDEFLRDMKKSGCYLLSFGAESGCPRILKKIKKGIMPDDILRSAKMALKHDIIPQYSFMIGLPGETKAEMKETLKIIDKLLKLSDKVQVLGPQAFRPYPGSELYKECVASGWKAPETLDEWADLSRNELNYMNVRNFPWVKDKDFVESMEAYVRFGAHSIKSALGSSVKAGSLLKLGFVLICQLRWKLKFFSFPIEFKLAKRFVVR